MCARTLGACPRRGKASGTVQDGLSKPLQRRLRLCLADESRTQLASQLQGLCRGREADVIGHLGRADACGPDAARLSARVPRSRIASPTECASAARWEEQVPESPEIAAFRAAERAYHESEGVSVVEQTFDVPRMNISARYLEAGEGPPVLMVHGGGGLASGWTPLIPHLPGFRLIIPDRPGCGLTGLVDYRDVVLRDHAVAFLLSVLDHAGVDRCSVVANSMGGLWSLWLARHRPERVERLALLGTPARLLETSAPGGMRLLGVPLLNRLVMALDPPSKKQVFTLWRRMGHDPEAMCPGPMTELMIRAEQLPNFVPGWLSLLQNVLPYARINPDVGFGEEDLVELDQPVLFIWGRSDPFGSLDVARRAQALAPNARLEEIGVGHLPWLDDPQTCGRVTTDFLRGAL